MALAKFSHLKMKTAGNKMSKNIVPLQHNIHSKLRLQANKNYYQVADQHMLPLVAAEFLPASTSLPIVFIKQQETGQFRAIALVGFEEGENLVFGEKVDTNYVPLDARRYPFFIGSESQNDENMVLCIDDNCKLLNESEGLSLFKEDGKITKEVEEVGNMLTDYLAKEQATTHFINFLVEHDLLQPVELSLRLGESGERKLNGLYKVNEETLNELSDDVALTLYKRKYFAAIYAHLGSLSQINRLLAIKAKK